MLAKIKAAISNNKNKILAAISFLAAGYFLYKYFDDDAHVIKMSSFLKAVEQNQVDKIIIKGDKICFSSNNSDWYETFIGRFPISQVYRLIGQKNISFQTSDNIVSPELVSACVTCLISAGTFKYIIGQINKPSLSSVQYKSNVYAGGASFDDFYGGEQIKEKFREVIDFLQNPDKYEKMGARIRRGVLLHGPPGTGKTLLARALANQAGCSFIKVVASQFRQIFVGVGSKRVRQLFQNARKCQNGCIIFIDEIDGLGSRLNHLRDSHETTTTINQFLSEMDGFYPNEKVLIMAATNRIDLVDHAILRAGRFDLKIFIPLPDASQRKGIFQKLMSKKVGELNNIDERFIDKIAAQSVNWCGADIQNLLNESIYKAIQQQKQFLTEQHVLSAFRQLVERK